MQRGYCKATAPSKLDAAAFYLLYFSVLGAMHPQLAPFLASRGMTPLTIAAATAVVSLAKLLYVPPVADAVGGGRIPSFVVMLHLVVASFAAMALNLSSKPLLAVVLFAVLGCGYGLPLPLVEAAVLGGRPEVRYGRVRMFGSAGFALAAIAVGISLDRFGLHLYPWLVAASLLLLALPTCRFGTALARPARHRGFVAPQLKLMLLLALLAINQAAHGPYYAFFSLHLERLGFHKSQIGLMWALAVIAEMLTFLLLEARASFDLRRVLLFSLATATARWALTAEASSLWVIALAQLGHAGSFAGAHFAGVQLVQRMSRPGAEARNQALYSGLVFGLGIVGGALASAPAYELWGGEATFLLACILSGFVLVTWAVIAERVR